MKLAKSFFIETIPYIDIAIRSTTSKSTMKAMECQCIDWVYFLHVSFLDPVTFKGIFPLLDIW